MKNAIEFIEWVVFLSVGVVAVVVGVGLTSGSFTLSPEKQIGLALSVLGCIAIRLVRLSYLGLAARLFPCRA
jgi:hypothetical protein